MALHIAQDFEYKGDDWWEWWIWLDGPDDELDQVEVVTYKLHPSFPKPVRKVTDRESKFQLKTAGWGRFTIAVKIDTKDGDVWKLKHDLDLEYPDET